MGGNADNSIDYVFCQNRRLSFDNHSQRSDIKKEYMLIDMTQYLSMIFCLFNKKPFVVC